jgi:hypothetical protein
MDIRNKDGADGWHRDGICLFNVTKRLHFGDKQTCTEKVVLCHLGYESKIG